MIQPRHPFRRPVPMLIVQLAISLLAFIPLLALGGARSYQGLIGATFYAAFAACGAITLFLLARKAVRADPNWPQIPSKLNTIWNAWAPACCMGYMAVGFGVNRSWGEMVLAVPFAIITIIGFCTLNIGATQRRGEERRCANCDYPTPKGTLTTLTVCPECGRSLGMPAAVVFGRKQMNVGLIVLGAMLFLIGSFAVMWARPAGAWLNARILAMLPTPMVANNALHATLADAAAWTELSTRRLTPAEAERIAEAITKIEFPRTAMMTWLQSTAYDPTLGTLAFRRIFIRAAINHRNHFYVLRDTAMAMCTTHGAADPEVRDEWFASMFKLEVFRDSDAKVGRPVRFVLKQGINATLPASGHFTMVAVTTVRFGNHSKTNLAACFTRTSTLNEIDSKQHIAEFTPLAPGPTQLTATVWLAYVPYLNAGERDRDCPCPDSSGYPYLKLNPDGTPIPPKNAVWFERQDLEKTITVAP